MNARPTDVGARFSEQFYTRLKRVLVPDLRNSQYLYAEQLHIRSSAARAWLDLGCGRDVVPAWAADAIAQLTPSVGVDPDFEALCSNKRVRFRVVSGGEALPFMDGSFDLVTANMVLEHVATPDQLFAEVARVLTPSGMFLVHTPNATGYTTLLTRLIPGGLRAVLAGALHDRRAEDVYATYYRANDALTLQRLARSSGFDKPTVEYALSSPQLIRIPPLLAMEMLLIVGLSSRMMSVLRPCLLVTFRRAQSR